MISIKEEYDEVRRKLDEIGDTRTVNRLSKSMFRAALRGGTKIAKRSLNASSRKRSGSLYRSIKGRISKQNRAVGYIGPTGSFNFMKAYTLEQGQTRTAKEPGFMTFKINGQWIRKKTVTQPARPWFERSVGTYLESGQVVKEMEQQLEKDLQKIMES